MEKNEKQVLDDYRQERKERIAKQNKAAAKKSNSHPGAKSVMGKIFSGLIAVVVAVAIIFGSLNFFGVPQRVVKAVTVDGESYSMSELSFYYMQIFNNYANYSYSYDSNYGEGYGVMLTGYDYTKSPAEQTKKDADGNEITWDEFFLDEAVSNIASIKRYYKAAVDAGIELDDDAKAEIEDAIESIKQQIESYKTSTTNPQAGNYSVSGFLTLQYGKGVTESFYRQILEEQKMVELYQQSRQDALSAEYSDEDIENEYAKAPSDYDVTDFRWFTFDVAEATESSSDTEETSEDSAAALEEAKQKAEDFIAKVKASSNFSEETFKKVVLDTVDKDDESYDTYKEEAATLLQKADKATIKSNVSEDAANWFFETNDDGAYVRQAGDMKYFASSDSKTVYVFYATGTPYRDETKQASVRHILVKFPDETTTEATSETASGEEDVSEETSEAAESGVSASDKEKCKKEAESILADYNTYITSNLKGEVDAEYFAELANEYSDDTASATNGGLIEGLANDGSYVPQFEDWVFAEGEFAGQERKTGTTGIIETQYGYHVMFFESESENPVWYQTIIDNFVTADWEAEQKAFDESFAEDAIVRKEKVEQWVKNACLDIIG